MSRILIVEDNDRNRKLFKLLLEWRGHQSLLARDGEEGVKVAREEKPDLILMDIQMPVMDGIAALKELLTLEETAKIPVIALTSYAMSGTREELLEHGFVDYMSKPIAKDEFLDMVEKALRRTNGKE